MTKQIKYRKYKGYGGKTTPFTVFLIHGKDEVLVRKLKKFIENTLMFRALILKDENNGKTIIEKLQEKVWEDSDCALAVMTAEDETILSGVNARPNVLFEIGYCLGYFDQLYVQDYKNDIRPVVLIKEDRTNLPSDLNGLELIDFSKTHVEERKQYYRICSAVEQRLNRLFDQIKEYYN